MNEEMRLIRKIQKKGDRAAAALIRKYYDEIYGYVCKQNSDRHTAMDLTQEIFISMLRTIVRYDGRQASFRTWLYKIATYKVVDWFRSRAYCVLKETLSFEDVEPIDGTDFTQSIEESEFLEQIRTYVNELPPDSQNVFRLHIFGGYSFAEIADCLQIPESSVKSKYYRLINCLRKEFPR